MDVQLGQEAARPSRVPVWGLLGSTALSVTGNAIVSVAMPILVLQRTGSAVLAGVVAAAAMAPLVLSALFGGALVDRFGRRRSSVAADLLSAAAVAALPLLDMTLGLGIPLILGLVALGAVFDGPGMAAREALRPDVAARAKMPLEKINSWGEAVDGIGGVAGPGLAGVLIALIGPMNTLWATVIMFFLASMLTFTVVPSVQHTGADRPAVEPYWQSVWQGLRFVWTEGALRATAITGMLIVLFLTPLSSVIMPAMMFQAGKPEQTGFVLAVFAVGGIIGAIGYGVIARFAGRRIVLLVALLLTSLAFLGFALSTNFGWLLALALVTGVVSGPINPVTAVVMQERTPEFMRGRVIGTIASLSLAASPLGAVVAGPIVEYSGPATAFLIIGLGCLLATVYAALTPGLRKIEPSDAPFAPAPQKATT
ncbi:MULTISPECIES: MFS transporter [unclassified Crossiella]|uniref:MFS transporter n=1 Tax=unclassified Crossiella TaxID=2620835 RepID=UPI001FFF77C8|nr:MULTISPECIES: MFS transporter [unclassified Crossiella]MCK2241424.1 MFS transporter [Crossiella sp. S99.2]MCK2257042.1 MFS transporter [Crossiella sp. S99.1]